MSHFSQKDSGFTLYAANKLLKMYRLLATYFDTDKWRLYEKETF